MTADGTRWGSLAVAGRRDRSGSRDGDRLDRARRALQLAAAGLVLLLLAGVVALLAVEHRDRARLVQVQRPDGPAMTAARTAGRVLFSYDAGRLQAGLAEALPLTTGLYTGAYQDATTRAVWPAATADQAVVTATVRQAGATAATSAQRLVVLVVLDRSTQRAGGAPTTEVEQLRMTLLPRHGRWLVSGVESL